MKILFLNTFDDPVDGGGTEVTLWTLMRSLVSAGHQCILLSTTREAGIRYEERDGVRVWRAGIRNVYWPSKNSKRPSSFSRLLWHGIDSYNPFMQSYLRKVISEEKPDVVSIHNLPGWSAAAWKTLRQLGIPCVQVLHDQYALCAKSSMYNDGDNCDQPCVSCRALRLPHRAMSQSVSAVVGVSRFVLDRHLHFGRFTQVKHREVIHNVRMARNLGIGKSSQPHEGFRVGFIGRLDPSKGVEGLLGAFARYERKDAELWIAGNGDKEYENALRRLSAADSRVRFLGRKSPEQFYPNVDIVVVPSLWNDTFPGVVFESFAFGKPVIGARRGGIAEMLHDEWNGLLFEPSEEGELLDAIKRLGSDDAERKAMADRCRESARPFLDVTSWVSDYVALYERLIRETGGGSSASIVKE